MKKIAILGSTGSIGTQTVDILPSIEAEVVALTTNRRIGLLEEQARALHPKMVCAFDENAAKELRVKLADTDIEVLTGMDGLIACASESGADIVVTAVVGMVGLLPTLAAINAGKDIALANKETLVCAGGIVMEAAREKACASCRSTPSIRLSFSVCRPRTETRSRRSCSRLLAARSSGKSSRKCAA